MDNASKALIIAGGVLIAVMIISLGVYVFQGAGTLSQSYDEKLTQDEINTYNNKFLVYEKDINAQNMVSLINLVKENNKKYSAVEDRQIKIFINNVELDLGVTTEQWEINIMQLEGPNKAPGYKFVTVKYNSNGYVSSMHYKI